MTDTTIDVQAPDDHEHAAHASDKDYVMIALGLAVLTAIEVGLSYWHALEGLYLVIPLLVVMAIKFFIVASRFMHLHFDSKTLSRLFYAGLFLACGVYLIALLTFHAFSKDRCTDGTRAGAKTQSSCPVR